MPRPVQWPPKVYFHRKTGQARIRVAGKDYYLGPFGSEEAKRRYAETLSKILAEGKAGPPKRAGAVGFTVNEVLERWDQHALEYFSARGRERESYRYAVRPLSRLYGRTPAADFGPDQLRELQQAMLTGSFLTPEDRQHHMTPKTGGWSRGVINARIKRIRTVWRWLEEAKLVPPGSWAALKVVRPVLSNRPGARDIKRPKSAPFEHVRRIIRHLKPHSRAMLLLQWWTGMRSGEVRTIRAGDVTIEGDNWIYQPREHKTDYLGHERVVIIGPRGQAVLRPWLEAARKRGEDSPCFPSQGSRGRGKGEPLTRTGYAEAIREAAILAGVKGFRAYLSRHVTRMRVSRKYGDEAARSILGQRRLEVTLGYGSLDMDLARDVQRKIG